ncbi:hypothetical protein MRB53_027663 [Persea americana]|uniref:Uncharacterized protein n=1 Tax=Persea americana TaxID=3435 RepID=A0ACC2LLQ7_PERAE|nr:hypothetical protein MRB53_027663 [Persea americana]
MLIVSVRKNGPLLTRDRHRLQTPRHSTLVLNGNKRRIFTVEGQSTELRKEKEERNVVCLQMMFLIDMISMAKASVFSE